MVRDVPYYSCKTFTYTTISLTVAMRWTGHIMHKGNKKYIQIVNIEREGIV
jgi:hypothetical protein